MRGVHVAGALQRTASCFSMQCQAVVWCTISPRGASLASAGGTMSFSLLRDLDYKLKLAYEHRYVLRSVLCAVHEMVVHTHEVRWRTRSTYACEACTAMRMENGVPWFASRLGRYRGRCLRRQLVAGRRHEQRRDAAEACCGAGACCGAEVRSCVEARCAHVCTFGVD